MSIYNYNLTTDFSNGINPSCLDRTIKEYGFTNTLYGVTVEYETNIISIEFDGDLSPSDINDLNTIISQHNPSTSCQLENNANIGGTKVDFVLSNKSGLEYIYNKNSSWAVGTTFIFEGSINWIPKKFSVISSLKAEATGSVRLYDITNNKEICSIYWTNISKQIVSTEIFYNIPTIPVIIEVQFKTNIKNRDARLHYLALY